jgi:uncharacterized Zn-binding protein involved in type VI secretion
VLVQRPSGGFRMPNAARMTDQETCPSGSTGTITTGARTVFIEGKAAARVGDKLDCGGGFTTIESGSPTVEIEGAKAARITDTTCHKGKIATGALTVIIGNGGGRTTTLDTAHQNGAPFVRG